MLDDIYKGGIVAITDAGEVAGRSAIDITRSTLLFARPQMLSAFLSALVTIAFFEGAYIADFELDFLKYGMPPGEQDLGPESFQISRQHG